MLHHIRSTELQNKLFEEAARVLRPAGVFAGTDSLQSRFISLIHLFDTLVLVDPETLPRRLTATGFEGKRQSLRVSVPRVETEITGLDPPI
jgi:SAM-dependent methyltransferase